MTEKDRNDRRVLSSDYMHWAKTQANARFNLASSGMPNFPLADLPVKLEELEITGTSGYGYAPLQEALATKTGAAKECVVAAAGTSMANHLAMAASIAPGDEVLIEHPTYGLLLEVARYLGANVRRFSRSPPAEPVRPADKIDNRFRVDVKEISKQLTPRTRLIVLTNLHNPSSALIDNDTLEEIGEAAARVGARVLVDEAYLEAAYELAPRSAFHLGEQFVVTSSLTKFYGLSGLRCGWILATPELATKIWRLNDLFSSTPVHAAERLSVIALRHLDLPAARARRLLEANRPLLTSFVRSRDDLDWAEQKYGTVAFPRVLGIDVEKLCALLVDKYETSVVPGRFFEMPECIRIGVGCETDILREGLERLGNALDQLSG
jgi:aspartate/methionine/tyrosine aminotransferase